MTEYELHIGDMVFVMGLKIIIGNGFVAMNNPDGKVHLSTAFRPFISQQESIVSEDDDDDYELEEKEYFSRSPRFMREAEKASFKIDPPPQSPIGEEMPWLLVLG